MNEDDVARVVEAVREKIDVTNLSLPDEYFYASLPLCVIDAVFSIGVTYASTRATVARWCERQVPEWRRIGRDGAGEHSISDLIEMLRRVTPGRAADEIFGNRQRTSSRSGILKAEAVLRFAGVLQRFEVEGFGDTEDPDRNLRIRDEIQDIPGQTSGVCWDYFLMLAGSDQFVKADRMICRFIATALGENAIKPRAARSLLQTAATSLGVAPRPLDYAIWTYQRSIVPVKDPPN